MVFWCGKGVEGWLCGGWPWDGPQLRHSICEGKIQGSGARALESAMEVPTVTWICFKNSVSIPWIFLVTTPTKS